MFDSPGRHSLTPPPPTQIQNGNVGHKDSTTGEPLRSHCSVSNCRITSRSGRGVVAINGFASVTGCFIHRCAATGIYVGDDDGEALIKNCDIVENGVGNQEREEGVGAGHSGVYQERGKVYVENCNVSGNRFTGFSGTNRNILQTSVTNCDFFANSSLPVEVSNDPPSFETQTIDNNQAGESGEARMRTKWGVTFKKKYDY